MSQSRETSTEADRGPAAVPLAMGRPVPAVCFGGGMRLKDPEVFERALRAGFRFFDTAFTYRNDHMVFASELGRRLLAGERESIVICSKTNLAQPLPQALGEALERMGVNRLELLLLHHPVAPGDDDHLGVLMRRWAELEHLVDVGRVGALGVSNTGPSLLTHLIDRARIPPVVDQVELHPYMWDRDLFEVARDTGVRLQAYCPLGSPWRAAETGRALPAADEAVTAIAQRHGVSPVQVILRWHIDKGVIPVVSARSEEHMRENLDVFGFELSPREVAAIDALERGDRIWRDEPKLAGLFGKVEGGRLTIPGEWPR
jgi:diketogulonate reductase-like aldo/keto reductase